MNYVSVDCGGTKSAFLLTDEKGNELARLKKGPANYLVNGLKETVDLLNEGVQELCEKSGTKLEDIDMALLAMAGFSSVEPDPNVLKQTKETFQFRYSLCNDVKNALTGSLLDEEGIHLIAGTGSIGMGSNGKEVTRSVGGWGYYCGADEGSGYWIGCNLLRHLEAQQDGREERTELYSYMCDKYALQSQRDILYLIINKLENNRTKIANITLDCVELARRNDPVCIQIMKDAGKELARIAKAIYKKSNFHDPVRISYSGSIFKSIDLMKEGFEEEIKDIPHVLAAPKLEPLTGGIILAMKLANKEYDQETIDNLKKADEKTI